MQNINKIKKKIDWDKYYSIEDKETWKNICIYEVLSEEFIREFYNRVDWCLISRYQKLSEKFIEEMANYVDWYFIFAYQKDLSNKFKEKYRRKY